MIKAAYGRGARMTLSGLLLAAIWLCLPAPPAKAYKTHRHIASFQVPGHKFLATSVGVDEASGHIYVAGLPFDIGNEGTGEAFNLNPNGTPSGTNPKLSLPTEFLPQAVAVDNSSGPSAGNVWLAGYFQGRRSNGEINPTNDEVIQYDATGAPTGVVISRSDIPPEGTPQGEGLPPVVNPPEPSRAWVFSAAVRENGNVLVASMMAPESGAEEFVHGIDVIDEFSPSGDFLRQIGKAASESYNPGPGMKRFLQIAVAPDGSIAVGDEQTILLSEDGNCLHSCEPFIPNHGNGDVAFDDEGDLLATFPEGEVREYNPAGDLLSVTSAPNPVNGLVVDNNRERIYVAAQIFSLLVSNVEVFGPRITLPDVETGPPIEVHGGMVKVSGEINADGGADATCEFEYVDEEAFEESGFEGADTAPCVPAGPFTGESTEPVVGELTPLNGGTTYHYRLAGRNSDGVNFGTGKTIITLGPSIGSEFVTEVSETSARLHAQINPNGNVTEYRFQYVDQAKFAASGWAEASEAGAATIPAGGEDVEVSVALGGLIPGTGYRFRLIATNAAPGEAVGKDASFVTVPPLGAGLPDGRAYEMVSPRDKNGANIQGEPNAMHAAADGSAVTFFSDAGIPGGEGAQGFPSYVASRAADGSGWTTQGLLPPASTGPNGTVVGWNEALSQVYLGNLQPEKSPVLYQRSVPGKTVQALAEGGKSKGEFAFGAESADGGEVLFEAGAASLAPGAVTGKHNAYLWQRDSGKVTLAGVLNNGKAPEGGSYAGPYDWFLRPGAFPSGNPESTIGGAVDYSLVAEHALSDNAQGVFFTAAATGQVYLRRHPTLPQSPMSGATCLNPDTAACTIEISRPNPGVVDPHAPKPAAFIGATADGSSALIMSGAKLTADATTGALDEGADLYRYDLATERLTDLTVDLSDANGAEVQGVLGASADGSRIYIAANGVLAPGATPGSCRVGEAVGSCNVYLLERGHATFVAKVEPGRFAIAGLKKAPRGSTESDILNWNPSSFVPGTSGSSGHEQTTARVSADGSVLLFRSDAKVTAYDNDEYNELYRYEIGAGTTCVSCSPTGEAAVGSGFLQGFSERFTGVKFDFSTITRNLSGDGKRVFFSTPQALLPEDVNGVSDVYEWEAPDPGNPGNSCESTAQDGGCLFLISTGTSPEPSYFADADGSGKNAFILTSQSLVRQDGDELADIYDARVGGGIVSQNAEPSPPCQGEQCAGPAVAPPARAAIGSAAIGSRNVPSFSCEKGFRVVKKKGKARCEQVKGRKRRHGHHGKRRNRAGTRSNGGKR